MKKTSFLLYTGAVAVLMSAALPQAYGKGTGAEASVYAQAATMEDVGPGRVHRALGHLSTINTRPNRTANYYIYLCPDTGCGTWKLAMPGIVASYSDMQKNNVEMILFGLQGEEDATNEFVSRYKIDFPAVHKDASGAGALPGYKAKYGSVTIVDADGTVVDEGGITLVKEWATVIAKNEKEQGNAAQADYDSSNGGSVSAMGRTKNMGGRSKSYTAKGEPSGSVGSVIASMNTFNAEANVGAKYFIYLSSASWCGPCRNLMPQVAEIYDELKGADVELLLIGFDSTQEAAENYLSTYNAKFPGVLRNNPKLQDLPGYTPACGIPHAIIVTATGQVLKEGHGSIILSWKEIIANAKDLSVSETVAKVNSVNTKPDVEAKYYMLVRGVTADVTSCPIREAQAVRSAKIADFVAKQYEDMQKRDLEIIYLADSSGDAGSIISSCAGGYCGAGLDDKNVSKLPGVEAISNHGGIPTVAIIEAATGRILAIGNEAVAYDWQLILDVNEGTAEEK